MKRFIETNPRESIEYPGFYHIPITKDSVISPEGVVISLKDGKVAKIDEPVGTKEYPSLYLQGFGYTTLHRTLAITFLKCPGSFDEYQTNHKNGVKTDFRLNNLEWITPSEDLLHAFESGFRSDNNVVLAKDLETGEIHEFYSQAACARMMGVSPGRLHNFIHKSKKTIPFIERWDVILKGGEWSDLTRKDVEKIQYSRNPMILIARFSKMELVLYESVTHVAEDYKVTPDEVRGWLDLGHIKDDIELRIFISSKFRLDKEHKEYLDKIVVKKNIHKRRRIKKNYIKNKPTPVEVIDLKTDKITNYDSVESFSKTVGVQRKTIQKSVWRRKGFWRHYKITYIRDRYDKAIKPRKRPTGNREPSK